MNDGIYLCFNAMAIYMYVGRYVDPWYINEIFKVEDIKSINRSISEDEIFANAAESTYLTALTSIIEQIRYQRQPFMELIYLFEGEIQSDQMLQSMCVLDNDANPRFRVDFNKFFA